MDTRMFGDAKTGQLVPIFGSDADGRPWEHLAFSPNPLPDATPALAADTHLRVADARAALAALDSTARFLPNPTLLRRPTLRREAQSTSALEGTYAPLADVFTADIDAPQTLNLREVLNFVSMADYAFAWTAEGRGVGLALLRDLQAILMRGTPAEGRQSGQVRHGQVVIGRREEVDLDEIPVRASRFVPPPGGPELAARLQDLLTWSEDPAREAMDPVIACAMAHYQFETLHPFHDGNGRIGRLLIVLNLLGGGVLAEPTLTVSPWFEGRRQQYYERLLHVSTDGDWNAWVAFFATGIRESAQLTMRQMRALVSVQDELKGKVRASGLRADTAHALVDYAIAHTSFTVRQVEHDLQVSYARANKLVGQLAELGILALNVSTGTTYNRVFYAPRVLAVLLGNG